MKLVLLFLFILRVHVTVGDPVSLFALKVTSHLLECPQKKKNLHGMFLMKPK